MKSGLHTFQFNIVNLRMDRNAIINVMLLAISVSLAVFIHPLALLIWPFFLVLDDVLFFSAGWAVFDTEIMIQRAYLFTHTPHDEQSGFGRDLGFNLYDGYLTETRE